MRIVAVIPAYNEAPRLGAVLVSLKGVVDEIIVVDDGSQDETSYVAQQEGVHLLRHDINRGQGAALKTGTMAALTLAPDIIVHLDADGQHDASTIALLLAPLKNQQADIVYGSRFAGVDAHGMPASRRVLLRVARLFSQYILGIPHVVTDPQSGLRAMRASVAEALVFAQDGMAHCSEILRWVTRSSFRWQEVPVRVHYTQASLQKGQKASHAFKIVWELLLGELAS
jgi:glycosyltransferase involved in cell wall biosynthesis